MCPGQLTRGEVTNPCMLAQPSLPVIALTTPCWRYSMKSIPADRPIFDSPVALGAEGVGGFLMRTNAVKACFGLEAADNFDGVSAA